MSRKALLLGVPAALLVAILMSVLGRGKTAPPVDRVRTGAISLRSSASVPPSDEPAEPALRVSPPPTVPPGVPAASGKGAETDRDERYALHPSHDDLLAAMDWDEFYRSARWPTPFELTDLIIRRLGAELSLTDEQCVRLQGLLEKEQDAAAKELLAKFGRESLDGIFSVQREMRSTQKDLWDGIVRVSEDVRKTFNREFEGAFDAAQMAAINDHLRNQNYVLCTGYMKRYGDDKLGVVTTRDASMRILGLGRRPWGYARFFDGGEVLATAARPPLK
jgi:hypothetical protein